jgi:hypothetical protein
MAHFVERLFVLVLGELLDAPIAQHARVQKILIDRDQLVVEHAVEQSDDFAIPFHDGSRNWTMLRLT